MFRAAVLSIVILFAAGPSAALLCQAWCHPDVAVRDACHHSLAGGSARMASGDDSCRDSARNVAILLKEDVRRASLLDAGVAVEPASSLLRALSRGDRQLRDQAGTPPHRQRPLSTPLRI